MSVRWTVAGFCGLLALGGAWAALAQASIGVYSAAQAGRGADLYTTHCARCHGAAMEGLDVAPPLAGSRFLGNWTGQPVGALAARIRTSMPLDNPGVLGQTDSAEITADILMANGYPAGQTDMPTGAHDLDAVTLDQPPAK